MALLGRPWKSIFLQVRTTFPAALNTIQRCPRNGLLHLVAELTDKALKFVLWLTRQAVRLSNKRGGLTAKSR